MKNRLHVYTGDGKGKTTAAMGLALRSLGHGRRVLIAQFLKDGSSGELRALEHLDGALVFRTQPLSGFVFRMTAAERARAAQAQTEQALRLAEEIRREKPAMAVLDELGEAVWLEMVTPEAARERLEDLDRRREEQPAAVPEAGPAEVPAPAPARELVPRGEQKTRFTDDQIAVLAAMEDKVRSADQLVDLTQIPTKRVLSALTMLQVQGAVEEHPGRRFSALVELEQ